MDVRELSLPETAMSAAEVSKLWRQLTEALARVDPMIVDDLYPAADDAAIQRLRAELIVPLPAEMEALYRVNNGEAVGLGRKSAVELFWVSEPTNVHGRVGYYFMPIDGIDGVITAFRQLPASGGAWEEHHGPVRPASDRWIPFAKDFGGNFLCIDLDPDVGGTPGQVIELVFDESRRQVVSSSLEEFLAGLLSHTRQ
jgi:cell wall assembly regulator SMI1